MAKDMIGNTLEKGDLVLCVLKSPNMLGTVEHISVLEQQNVPPTIVVSVRMPLAGPLNIIADGVFKLAKENKRA